MLTGGDNSLTLEELLERHPYPRGHFDGSRSHRLHMYSLQIGQYSTSSVDPQTTHRGTVIHPTSSLLHYLYEYGVASSRGAIGELHHSVHVDRGLLVYLTVVEGEGVTRLRSIPLEGLTWTEGSTQALRVVACDGGGLHTGVIAGGEHGCLHGGPTLELV